MRMMYKSGKQTVIWGISVDYQIVEDHEVDAYLSLGWVKHPMDLIKTESEPTSIIPDIPVVESEVVPVSVKPKAKRGKKA